jgi:DNA-binding GntR family transcriptional regulator
MLAKQSRTDRAVNELRAAIIAGTLEPGAPLRQDRIARRLGLSHIPVREALRRLDADGFVKITPMCGATVAALSAREIEELSEMRVALELLALRLAAPKIGSAELRRAGEILNRMDRMSPRWGELNTEFHLVLYAPADRPRLLQQIESLHKNIERYVVHEEKVGKGLRGTQKEHRLLLELLRDEKIDDAMALLSDHIIVPSRLLATELRSKGLG